jgi:hypothetical protein
MVVGDQSVIDLLALGEIIFDSYLECDWAIRYGESKKIKKVWRVVGQSFLISIIVTSYRDWEHHRWFWRCFAR